MSAEPTVVDHAGRHRFEATVGGRVAELVYRREGDRLVLVHTGVPDELEGEGIGSALVRASIDAAREEGLTVVPECPFARAWLQRHPDVAATVAVDWPSRG